MVFLSTFLCVRACYGEPQKKLLRVRFGVGAGRSLLCASFVSARPFDNLCTHLVAWKKCVLL